MVWETLTLEHRYYSIVDTERGHQESLALDHILEGYHFHNKSNIPA